jgi:exoribonuclease-2
VGEKLILELPGGETVRVRPKDVQMLHPGPLSSLEALRAPGGEIEAAWEVLQGTRTTVAELAELAFGEYSPGTAWAAWQLVSDGVYFRGAPDAVEVNSREEVERILASRRAEEAEKRAWAAFSGRARRNDVAPEDRRFWQEVETRAYGGENGGRVLRALGREDSPESAHQLLLDAGLWDSTINPHPRRLGLLLIPPARELASPWPPPHLTEMDDLRADLTALEAFAIDDEMTDTPDDAISFGCVPGVLSGEPHLWVHIADAASVVLPESPLDLEARGRGAALHIPEGHVPMLPQEIIALLGLGLDRTSRALSFALRFDASGAPEIAAILPSWTRVQRLSYDEADERLGAAPFDAMYEAALGYEQRRSLHGRVAIELPEVDVRALGDGVLIRPVAPSRSRTLVENAMIMTGEAVAQYAAANGIAVPYATQETVEAAGLVPDPGSMASMYAARKLMKRSQYRLTASPHAGLGLDAYVQSTSPLRRYLDLVVHQQLRAHLVQTGIETSSAATPYARALEAQEILARIGAVEPALGDVRTAETLSDRHWTLVHLLHHPGWAGSGVVVEHRGRQTMILLPDLALETQLHLRDELPLDANVRLAVAESIPVSRGSARIAAAD